MRPTEVERHGGNTRGDALPFWGRASIEPSASPALVIEPPYSEQKILLALFDALGSDVYPVATDRFLNKSKSAYNEHWLTRELVQNFVDHNHECPGTLDGVTFTEQELSGGVRRFTITGPWRFDSPTGLMSPHSEKPSERENAGGNGIGLKQTAIRLLRDFHVTRFEIQGGDWDFNYELANRNAINDRLFRFGVDAPECQIEHDWLVGVSRPAPERSSTSYVIETSDAKLIAALRTFPEIGVSSTNTYLQCEDFSSPSGSVSWLCPKNDSEALASGRLFINGQVMGFAAAPDGGTNDFWGGPEGVTIRLDNLAYKMSIDRPPTSINDFRTYIAPLVDSICKRGELLTQLRRSEPLWSRFSSDYPAFSEAHHVLLYALVSKLRFDGYKPADYQRDFPNRQYAFKDRNVSDEQVAELKRKGLIIVPAYFEGLGMPSASSHLDERERFFGKLPELVSHRMTELAEKSGISVAANPLPSVRNAANLGRTFRELFSDSISRVTLQNPERIEVELDINLAKDILSHPLPHPKGGQQLALYNLRGVILKLLELGVADSVSSTHADYVSTYKIGYDSVVEASVLEVLNNPSKSNCLRTTITIGLSGKRSKNFIEAFIPETIPAAVEAPGATPIRDAEPAAKNQKKREMPDEGEGLLGEIQRSGASEAARKLAQVVERANQEPESVRPGEKLNAWQQSDNFYGQLSRGARYVTTASLEQILDENEEAVIPHADRGARSAAMPKTLTDLFLSIQRIGNALSETPGADFEILEHPSAAQLGNLQMLLTYAEIALDHTIPNDLFVYSGKGSKGINIAQRAIGLHQGTLKAKFHEALSVFLHEVAHNYSMDHDNAFIHMDEALQTRVRVKLDTIAAKQHAGLELTEQEKFLLGVEKRWSDA